MKFITLAEHEHSKADFAGIFEFHNNGLAKAAAAAINDSQWANAKGRVQEGYTGAFQVGHYVVFNSYSEEAFAGISKLVKDLHAPEAEREALWDDFWTSLSDANTPYSAARELAVDYLTQVLPGATVKKADAETDISIKYNGTTFIAQLDWNGPDSCIMVFIDSRAASANLSVFDIYDDTADVKQAFDLHVKGVTPESAMFAAMKDINFSKALPKNTETKLKGIANLFFQSWLKDASLVGVETICEIESVKWVEACFLYKGKTYHLDFCMEGDNTLCLYTTNKYQENVDCTYVTVDTLQEKIDSVDDTGYFPGHAPGCTREEVHGLDREIPRKSLEERLDKVEHLIAALQEEVTEIKKKI